MERETKLTHFKNCVIIIFRGKRS